MTLTTLNLKLLIKEEIRKYILPEFDITLDDLTINEYANLQWNYIRLMSEVKIDTSNIYKAIKMSNPAMDGYYFYDSNNKRHVTNCQKHTHVVKIGPAANDKDLTIIPKKSSNIKDPKILNTHVANILKLIDDLKLKEISFTAESGDGYGNARKRLFLGLINNFIGQIERVVNNEDNFIIYLK